MSARDTTPIAPLMGEEENSIIQAMTIYSQSVVINELGHVRSPSSQNSIVVECWSAQRLLVI